MYFCCKNHNTPPAQHTYIIQNNQKHNATHHFRGIFARQQRLQLHWHPFGCRNAALILNGDDWGVRMRPYLRMMVEHERTCHTINSHCLDGCCVCFTAREYPTGDNGQPLDGAFVKITAIFMPDHENWSI